MQNPLSSKVKQIDETIYVELPAQVTDTLNIKEGESIEFGLSKHVEIWKSQQVPISKEIVPLLRAAFKSEDYIFRIVRAFKRPCNGA